MTNIDIYECCKYFKNMVGSTELESVTSCVSSRRSNQLSYEPGMERTSRANLQYITALSLR